MIVAVPDWFAAGVIVTVRFAPLPPNTMLAVGTSAVFDEPPVIVSDAAAVSMSPTVKLIAPVAVSSFVVLSVTSEIVGGVVDRRHRQHEAVARGAAVAVASPSS